MEEVRQFYGQIIGSLCNMESVFQEILVHRRHMVSVRVHDGSNEKCR